MADNKPAANQADQILASVPQLAQNPLLNLVLTVVLGGSAVGGFFVNNSQWAEVSAELKALRQELTHITIRLTQFDSKVESIERLEATQRASDTAARDLTNRIIRLELELEALKKPKSQ